MKASADHINIFFWDIRSFGGFCFVLFKTKNEFSQPFGSTQYSITKAGNMQC